MVNVQKLRGVIVERGYTQERLAKEIPMDKSTFSRKMAGDGEDFSIEQADRISKILNLTKDEAIDIFFSQYGR